MAPSDIHHYILEPATFRLDGGAMFGIIPKPLWEKRMNPDELNRVKMALRLWLIKTHSRIILIDTGIGDYHGEKFDSIFDVVGEKDALEKALNQIGLSQNDVTDIIMSHMHFDHAGGLIKKNEDGIFFAFKKAQLHLHRTHYEYSLNPTQRDRGSFHSHLYKDVIEKLDNEKRVSWYDAQEGELIEGITFKASFGHTPWMIHPMFDGHVYLADLIPTSHHIKIPWVMGYDIAAGQTTKDKADFLKYICENKKKCIFEHDPKLWGATIKFGQKGYEVDESFLRKDKEGYCVD